MSATLRLGALRWFAEGRRAMVIEVAATQGSAPRDAGARMVVAADETIGSIGGGHLEHVATAQARARLAGARDGAAAVSGARPPDDAAAIERRFALGPSLGQCCGGTVTLRTRPLDAAALADWPEPVPRFHLQLHGAGHVGRAIAALLAGIACRVQWIDARDEAFAAGPDGGPAVDAPHIERLCIDTPEAEVAQAPARSCFLVLTHDHALDERIVEAVLERDDAAWCGLIGSDAKRARFERRLRARGLSETALARLVCPVGLPGIEGKEPEIVAVAVVAQLLALGSTGAAGAARAPEAPASRLRAFGPA